MGQHITDIYFYEELRNSVGEEASRMLLANFEFVKSKVTPAVQNRSQEISATGPSPGRDVPTAKAPPKICTYSNGMDEAKKLDKSSDSLTDRKFDANFRTQGTSCPQFKKTPSLESKMGLLFTDAAHTILE